MCLWHSGKKHSVPLTAERQLSCSLAEGVLNSQQRGSGLSCSLAEGVLNSQQRGSGLSCSLGLVIFALVVWWNITHLKPMLSMSVASFCRFFDLKWISGYSWIYKHNLVLPQWLWTYIIPSEGEFCLFSSLSPLKLCNQKLGFMNYIIPSKG